MDDLIWFLPTPPMALYAEIPNHGDCPPDFSTVGPESHRGAPAYIRAGSATRNVQVWTYCARFRATPNAMRTLGIRILGKSGARNSVMDCTTCKVRC